MTRILVILALAAAAIAGVVVFTMSGDENDGPLTYRVELDNASGLTEGADLRAAGVKVGSIKKLDVEAKTAKAIATVEVARPEFGGLREDAECAIKPQSLIGEYFMDCEPGTKERLPRGGTVPIERTSGTIGPDIVNNVLRLPQRQKLQLILSEFGAGFAARGGDVNETIRRAIPALRETDEVLRILGDERETLAQLTRDADTVIGALDGNKEDVSRFVAEARDTAVISAGRRDDIAGSIRRLPTFQRILRPTLRDLGEAARAQTPALRDLRLASPALTTLLDRLGPFSDASRPAIRALGRTSVTGLTAVRDVRGTVRTLRRLAASGREPMKNLRFVLEHVDDRDNAVERNPLSPGGAGFTGLEAITQYFFTQSQAINLFDDNGYVLKLNAIISECSNFTNGSTALKNPERTKKCSAALGPGGKFEPTPGRSSTPRAAKPRSADSSNSGTETRSANRDAGSSPAPRTASNGSNPLPSLPGAPALPPVNVPTPPLTGETKQADPGTSSNLLDFLLG